MNRQEYVLVGGWIFGLTVGTLSAASPPASDALTENSAAQWSAWAEFATASVFDDAARVQVGTRSLRFETTGGFDTSMWNPTARNANWDFTYVQALRFRVYAENPSPYDFQNNSPWIRLGTGPGTGNYWQYQANYEAYNPAVGNWVELVIPFDGDATWSRAKVGNPNRADIDYIEIHADTWDAGFTVWYDGMAFDAVPLNPTGLAAIAGDSVVNLSWDPYINRPGFQHFAIYRSTTPFSSVVAMSPIATVPNAAATTFADTLAVNGTSYYYAVTAVISGSQDTTVTSVGPRTPWPKSDLDLTPYYSSVRVAWAPVTLPDVAGYEIYRRTPQGSFPAVPTARVLRRASFTDSGLTPGQSYVYKAVAIDGAGHGVAEFTNDTATTLASSDAGLSHHKKLDLLLVFYTGGYSQSQIDRTVAGINLALDFYWRTSSGELLMDPTWLFMPGDPPGTGTDWGNSTLQNQLRAVGVQNDQYDLAYLIGQDLAGCFGGYVIFGSTCASLGTVCGVPYPGKDPNIDYTIAWTFTHEIHHALEVMENITAGTPEVLFCHFPWAYPEALGPTGWHIDWGPHFDGIAQTNRDYGDKWNTFPAPYAGYIECVDADGDDLPDDDNRVPVDEVRFGSSPLLADTDDDGLDDLGELAAYTYRTTDPLSPDTDGDGRPDGADHQPLYGVNTFIPAFTTPPVIDGNIEPAWRRLAGGYYYTNNSTDFPLVTYAGYDANAIYLAFDSTRQLRFMISLDGSGQDGRFESPVRHVSGATDTDNLNNKQNHYGDSWADGNHLYTFYGGFNVQVVGRSAVAGAQVSSSFASGRYRTEVKIPRVLPAGAAFTWYPSNAPVVDGLTLTEGQIIGLNVTFSNLSGSNSSEFSGTWTGLFETHSFVDFVLEPHTPADFDGDGDVDMKDFAHFQVCLTGADVAQTVEACLDARLDGDTDVDGDDFIRFGACLSGADVPANPACGT